MILFIKDSEKLKWYFIPPQKRLEDKILVEETIAPSSKDKEYVEQMSQKKLQKIILKNMKKDFSKFLFYAGIVSPNDLKEPEG